MYGSGGVGFVFALRLRPQDVSVLIRCIAVWCSERGVSASLTLLSVLSSVLSVPRAVLHACDVLGARVMS